MSLGAKIALAAAVVAAGALLAFPRFTVDDAYITARYAENLARHGELTFNVGQDPVEGYTGIALPALLAAGVEAGASPVGLAKVVGVASYFAAGALLFALARRLGARDSVAGAVAGLYFLSPFLWTHALAGLETSLFAAAVLGSVHALAGCVGDAASSHALARRSARRSAQRELVLWGWLLLAGLVRPEGVPLAAACLVALVVARWIDARRNDAPESHATASNELTTASSERASDDMRAGRRPARMHFAARFALSRMPFAARFVLAYALPAAVYFAWRTWYYGAPLPNTYYAKWAARTDWAAVRDMGRFALAYVAIPTTALAFLAAANFGSLRESVRAMRSRDGETLRRAAVVLGACALFALVVLFQYRRSALIMNYSHRFFAPFFPLFLAAVAVGLEGCARSIALRRPTGARRAAALAAVLLFALQLAANARLLRSELAFARVTGSLLESEHLPAGRFLGAALPPDAWIAVVVDAGAIPYASGLRTIDVGGLNDEFLGRRWYTRMPANRAADYVYGYDPAAIVFTSSRPDVPESPNAPTLADDARFAAYELVRAYGCADAPDYFELVYMKRSSP